MTSSDAARLSVLVDQFQEKRVLVIGDLMLDEYLYGHVDRVSPEAPVPVVALQHRESQPGGAANVALNVAALGASVDLIGLCGQDDTGSQLREALHHSGIDARGLVLSAHRRTTRKTRIISQGQQLLRIDTEDDDATSEHELTSLIAKFDDLIGQRPDVIIFEDYDKGALSPKLISYIVSRAQDLAIPTVVDPKLRNFWSYQGVTLFKPNLKEIRAALPGEDINATKFDSLARGHEAITARLGHGGSLITLGAAGAYIHGRDFNARVGAHRRRIADVCGAGDSVVATAALALACGAPLSDVLEVANLAGGLACEYLGVHPLQREDFKRGLSEVTPDQE